MEGPLLICFDGSDGAREALEAAARAFHGREAVVACYWQPFASENGRFRRHLLEMVQDANSINEQEQQLAREIAEEGAELAHGLGLTAEAAAVGIDAPIQEAVLNHADELSASAIVLGARAGSSLRSLLVGDVAFEVMQRATRPVFVVPSSRLSERRRDALARGRASET
jgi:nucleotide-binding universal stress UspA family protein